MRCSTCGRLLELDPIDSMTSDEIKAAIEEWADAFRRYRRRHTRLMDPDNG